MHSTHAPALHSAVDDAHAALPTQRPPLQLCGMFVPGWHRVCPAAQSVHAPAWHVPASLPTAHTVPSCLAETPHVFPAHTACRHGFVGAAHWATDVHCTQLPVLFSQ